MVLLVLELTLEHFAPRPPRPHQHERDAQPFDHYVDRLAFQMAVELAD